MKKYKFPQKAILLFLLAGCVQWGCEERSFPVSEIEDPYPYIPPSDVGMLSIVTGDGTAKLVWSDPPEDDVTEIQVTNLNDNTMKTVSKGDQTVEFGGLKNFEKYAFRLNAKSDKELYSVGTIISGYPYLKDNVAPDEVTGVIGFSGTSSKEAILVFTPPANMDYSHAIAYYNTKESASSVIRGKVMKLKTENESGISDIIIKAYDFSSNESPGIKVEKPSTPLALISGGDQETTVLVKWTLHPAADFVAGYQVAWGDNFARTITLDGDATQYTFPMEQMENNKQVNISMLDENSTILGVYALTLDGISIPGTVKASTTLNYSGVKIRDDGGFGNVDNNSWAEYELHVKEEGDYQLCVYTSGPEATSVDLFAGSEKLTTVKTSPSGNWDTFKKQEPSESFHLTAGKQSVKFVFGGGQNILKYYFIQK